MNIEIYGDLKPEPNPFITIFADRPLYTSPRVKFREYDAGKISWFSINGRKYKLNIHSLRKSNKNDLLKLLRTKNITNKRKLFKFQCLTTEEKKRVQDKSNKRGIMC